MGSIYARAYVTIVSAVDDLTHGILGIEGVSKPLKKEIPLSHTSSSQEAYPVVLRNRNSSVQSTIWNTRGWTFQEQIFSRRLLAFTETSVTWECHCATWVEGSRLRKKSCQNNTQMVAQGFAFHMNPSFEDYEGHASVYNARHLSYPEDAADALSGMLHVLSNTLNGGFVACLPVMYFATALCWGNYFELEPRKPKRGNAIMPPTWSWAAWRGEIGWRKVAHYDTEPMCKWRCCDVESRQWIEIQVDIESNQKQEMGYGQPFLNTCVRVSNDDVRADLTRSLLHAGVSHVLVGHVQRTFVMLEKFDYNYVGRISGVHVLPRSSHTSASSIRLTLCQRLNQTCHIGDELELIAISKSGAYVEVLCIERKTHLAYRKGIVTILQSDWESLGLAEIEVLLA